MPLIGAAFFLKHQQVWQSLPRFGNTPESHVARQRGGRTPFETFRANLCIVQPIPLRSLFYRCRGCVFSTMCFVPQHVLSGFMSLAVFFIMVASCRPGACALRAPSLTRKARRPPKRSSARTRPGEASFLSLCVLLRSKATRQNRPLTIYLYISICVVSANNTLRRTKTTP